ncbi:MAG: zinc ribbon domain-containing protein [Anaerolineae bacterium]
MEIAILVWLAFGVLTGYICQKKGIGFGWGCALGFLLGPIGTLIALLSKGRLRRCPYCAEMVRPEATVCKHCGKDLPPLEPAAPAVTREPSRASRMVGIAILVVLGLVIAGALAWYYVPKVRLLISERSLSARLICRPGQTTVGLIGGDPTRPSVLARDDGTPIVKYTAPCGEEVKITHQAEIMGGSYYWVILPDTRAGWVPVEQVGRGTPSENRLPTSTPHLAWLSCKDCADAGMLINLWDSPQRGRVTGRLPHGTLVTILDSRDGHYLVSARGKRGWVSEAMISSVKPAE